jgi:hypothetical protein
MLLAVAAPPLQSIHAQWNVLHCLDDDSSEAMENGTGHHGAGQRVNLT